MPQNSRFSLHDVSHRDPLVLRNLDDNRQLRPRSSWQATGDCSSTSTPSLSGKRRRSVRSIAEEFELHQSPSVETLGSVNAKRSSSNPLLASTEASRLGSERERSENRLQVHLDRFENNHTKTLQNSRQKNQRASVLLASANYPSTLRINEARFGSNRRSISGDFLEKVAQDRFSSLRAASGAYSNSYNGPSILDSHSTSSSIKRDMSAHSHSSRTSTLLSPPTVSISHDHGAATGGISLNVTTSLEDGKARKMEDEEGDVMTELSSCPPSPTKDRLSAMTSAERREHSRRHSRVHSRNLSVFFPQPGSEAERENDHIRANSQFGKPVMTLQTYSINGSDKIEKSEVGNSSGLSTSPTKSRRGHHRNHSVNHAFLNVTHSAPTREEAISPKTTRFTLPEEAPTRHYGSKNGITKDMDNTSDYLQALCQPITHHLQLSSLPRSHRPLLLFGCLELILGAMLWWHGQSGDSLSLTGLGYLIVFDAFGILNGVAAECLSEGWRRQEASQFAKETFRKPYGPYRIETVLQFSQTVYLLFASIYVCKESVEHALLEGEEGHHEQDDVGVYLPKVLLILSSAFCLFSIMVLQNHDKLVAACGIATSSGDKTTSATAAHRRSTHGRRNSILVDASTLAGPFIHLLANPFSITIVFFCVTLTLASLIMPPFQVAALDKVLAGLESVAMLYIAYPASVALGKILLQTAPKAHNTQNVQLMRSLQTIGEHPLVTYVAPPHLWQLTPPTSARNQYKSGNPSLLGAQRIAKNAALIAMIQIFLKEEASDENILQVTKWSWSLLAPAVGAGAGLRAGESLRGAIRAGEVNVSVCRESQREKYRLEQQQYQRQEKDHSHHHVHSCNSKEKHTHNHNEHRHNHTHAQDHHQHQHNHHEHHQHNHQQEAHQHLDSHSDHHHDIKEESGNHLHSH